MTLQMIVWILSIVTLLGGWAFGVMRVLAAMEGAKHAAQLAAQQLMNHLNEIDLGAKMRDQDHSAHLLEAKQLIENDMTRLEAKIGLSIAAQEGQRREDTLRIDGRLDRIEDRVTRIEKLLEDATTLRTEQRAPRKRHEEDSQ